MNLKVTVAQNAFSIVSVEKTVLFTKPLPFIITAIVIL